MKKIYLSIFISFLILLSSPLYAGEFSLHGKGQTNNSFRINEKGNHPGSLVAEQGIQIEIRNSSESGNSELFVKADLWNDTIDNIGSVVIREAYGLYSDGPFDFTFGRQILTWGVGDRIFVSDVFSKDWAAFYTGRPLEYMKLPSSGLKADYYGDAIEIEMVWLPVFEPDKQPSPERFILPGMGTVSPPIRKNSNDLGDSELAVRFTKGIGEITTALHLYHGFWRQYDKGLTDNGTSFYYPRLNVYSLTLQRAIANGILSMEGGYYESPDDKNGKKSFIENSQWRYLVGFEREIVTDLLGGIQYYGESLDNTGDIGTRPEQKQMATLSLRQSMLSQTLILSLWTMYDINERDYYLKIETKYSLTDELELSLGGNLLEAGTGAGFFGQLDKNDNVYLNAAYKF